MGTTSPSDTHSPAAWVSHFGSYWRKVNCNTERERGTQLQVFPPTNKEITSVTFPHQRATFCNSSSMLPYVIIVQTSDTIDPVVVLLSYYPSIANCETCSVAKGFPTIARGGLRLPYLHGRGFPLWQTNTTQSANRILCGGVNVWFSPYIPPHGP